MTQSEWLVPVMMTEAEWLNADHPLLLQDFLHRRASDRKLRLFACACCRRVCHLLTDERSRKAVEAAEHFADGCLSPGQFVLARAAAQEAFLKLKREEHEVEAMVSFYRTTEYSIVCARLYASAAARLTVSISADRPIELRYAYRENEEEWEDDYSRPGRGCSYWTIAAVGEDERARVYAEYSAGRLDDSKFDLWEAALAAETKKERSEAVAHISLLRDIFGNPFRAFTLDPCLLEWNDCTVRKIAQALYTEKAFDRLPILADALEEAGCTSIDILNHCRQPGAHVRGCWVVDLILGRS